VTAARCGFRRARGYVFSSLLALLLAGTAGALISVAGSAIRPAPADITTVQRDDEPMEEDMPPEIAIVLDDCGGNVELARRVLSLGLPMTWAIIPNLKYSEKTAEMLLSSGVPFLVHVPMQALSDPDGDTGRYVIGTGMERRQVRAALIPLLDSLDGAYGINNHRGSKATSDAELMGFVMEVLAERGMFFLDSRTSSRSVAYEAALENGLDAASNSLFLDNEPDKNEISGRMKKALADARGKGGIIVICHLRTATVAFLEDFALEIKDGRHETGVRLITLPQWVESAKGEIKWRTGRGF
jgi:polysaccharide deacetylase 2 family uncharacterized protein YibQ